MGEKNAKCKKRHCESFSKLGKQSVHKKHWTNFPSKSFTMIHLATTGACIGMRTLNEEIQGCHYTHPLHQHTWEAHHSLSLVWHLDRPSLPFLNTLRVAAGSGFEAKKNKLTRNPRGYVTEQRLRAQNNSTHSKERRPPFSEVLVATVPIPWPTPIRDARLGG